MRGIVTVRTNLQRRARESRAVDFEHGPLGRTIRQNSPDNLKPSIIAESCENKRGVASAAHVLRSQPKFKAWKHTPVMKRDNPFGDLKLLPEHRCGLELLHEAR